MLVHVSQGLGTAVKRSVRRCGHTDAGHQFFGKSLVALDPCCPFRWPEDGQPHFLETVDDPCGKCRLGPDHGEIDACRSGKIPQLEDFRLQLGSL